MVGLYLPGSVHLPAAFLATQSAGVAAVLIDDAHAADLVASATRLSAIRRVLTSRHLADRDAAKVIEDLEAGGARIQYAEDVVEGANAWQRMSARLMRHRAVARSSREAIAAIFLASDGTDEGLQALSHRRLLTSVAQIAARLRLARRGRAGQRLAALPAGRPRRRPAAAAGGRSASAARGRGQRRPVGPRYRGRASCCLPRPHRPKPFWPLGRTPPRICAWCFAAMGPARPPVPDLGQLWHRDPASLHACRGDRARHPVQCKP